MLCENLSVSPQGHLLFAGQDTVALAREYGTPLYLLDGDRLRRNCRVYTRAFREYFPEGSLPLYASKANAFTGMYRLIAQEGMGIDVVSAGEIAAAVRAGFPMERAWFHSNNKTDGDIRYAMDRGVGRFVVDTREELLAIEEEASRRGLRQKILLRITPGIDPHTYEAVNTGMVDSKFGSAIETGQAAAITGEALALAHIELEGFHCHVGSQVFEEDVFLRTVDVMVRFLADRKRQFGYTARALDLGGGYGVRYVESDPTVDIGEKLRELAGAFRDACTREGIEPPVFHMEPGRSIVADAGLTLYTVGSVKRIPRYKNYVSVDGGMTDNPRYALYGARYTCLLANRCAEEADLPCSLVGRCCESGDIIQPDILLPSRVRRGDIAAVCTTGAYNYSMASHYNRLPKPPVVLLSGGKHTLAVRRETPEDLCRLDV